MDYQLIEKHSFLTEGGAPSTDHLKIESVTIGSDRQRLDLSYLFEKLDRGLQAKHLSREIKVEGFVLSMPGWAKYGVTSGDSDMTSSSAAIAPALLASTFLAVTLGKT
jgi:hypothetical protein